YLVKRLSGQFPDLKILVGRWGQSEGLDKVRERLRAAGAAQVVASVVELRDLIVPLLPVAAASSAPKAEPQMAGARWRLRSRQGKERGPPIRDGNGGPEGQINTSRRPAQASTAWRSGDVPQMPDRLSSTGPSMRRPPSLVVTLSITSSTCGARLPGRRC